MLRIENDIKALQGFANRAYSNEMNTQKTIVKDLLGGKSHASEHKVSSIYFTILLLTSGDVPVCRRAKCDAAKLCRSSHRPS